MIIDHDQLDSFLGRSILIKGYCLFGKGWFFGKDIDRSVFVSAWTSFCGMFWKNDCGNCSCAAKFDGQLFTQTGKFAFSGYLQKGGQIDAPLPPPPPPLPETDGEGVTPSLITVVDSLAAKENKEPDALLKDATTLLEIFVPFAVEELTATEMLI